MYQIFVLLSLTSLVQSQEIKKFGTIFSCISQGSFRWVLILFGEALSTAH